ncbi:hypothetical protein F4777DRAFT_598705 [Nemania sp. FL0916]|nr:hypothetical protein F4777DRAFT_598705 [Nemania sp. FL0916]
MQNNMFDIPFDECLSLESAPLVACTSSTGSLSSASTFNGPLGDPYTPPSGRSTPGHRPLLVDQNGGTLDKYRCSIPSGFESGYELHHGPIQLADTDIEHLTQSQMGYYSNPPPQQQLWHWPVEGSTDHLRYSKISASDIIADDPPTHEHRPYAQLATMHLQGSIRGNILHERKRAQPRAVQEEAAAPLRRTQKGGVSKPRGKKRTAHEKIGEPLSVTEPNGFPCDHADCAGLGKKFQRREHLTRHYRS